MRPEEIYGKLLRSEKERERLASALKYLFSYFLKDWTRWEVLGWILALYMGFSYEEISARPELGWFAKVALAHALVQSENKEHRLLGRALLYHTELPPEDLFVVHGGELVPAVVYHYRASWNSPKIRRELDEVVDRLLFGRALTTAATR